MNYGKFFFGAADAGKLRLHTAILLLSWTVLIVGFAVWNVYQVRTDSIEKARIEARTILEHNIAYRRWNSSYGGVYVPVGESVQPNPYIVSPRRDLTATDGTQLTLVNPFQMTKQAYTLLREQSPLSAINRTVSLNPMNPENSPDPWEARSLKEFDKGVREVSEVTAIKGQPYVRVLQPYVTYKPCLHCHAVQGYRPGDIRGGMSIAVPLQPYFQGEASSRRTILVTHTAIWLAGLLGITGLVRGLRREQLRTAENEWKFRTLSDHSQDWQYWITQDGRVVHTTPSCERMTGHPASEFMENPAMIYNVIHPEDRPAFERHLRDDFTMPKHDEMDFRIVTAAGQTKRIFHVCGPIYQGGVLLGRHVSNRDVTDRKQLEEQLLQAQKMESLGLFAGGIAHDFNNILTVITGYATVLQKKLASADETIRKQLQDVVNASLKARSLVSSLLAFGRKQVMRRSTVSLNRIISNIADILRRILGEDIALDIHCSPIEFLVHADSHQMEQVIMNLMTNARDAMPRGGRIAIRTEPLVIDALSGERLGVPAGKYMLLSVQDSGAGIEPADVEHIFEPFFTTKEAGKGTGLGLAMVYGIVKQHEGVIQVASRKGSGTTFSIYLPATPHADPRQEQQALAPDKAGRGAEAVLLVEDDDLVRGFLQDILEANGYQVIAVPDGESALAELMERGDRLDIAVIDIVLPRMNGRELYQECVRIYPRFRTLFMSGYSSDELTARGLTDNSMTVIQKPVDIEKLLLALRTALASDRIG